MRCWIIFALALPLAGATVEECQKDAHYGRRAEAKACYNQLVANGNPSIRAEGYWGLKKYDDANKEFRSAVAQSPKVAEIRVRWGRLLLERFNQEDAMGLFNEALEIDPKSANAMLGMAEVAADDFERKAEELARKALELDPKLVEAQELLASMALEDNNPEKAAAEADKALKLDPESLDAMAIHQTIDWLEEKKTTNWMDRVLKINPNYGEAYALAGHFFVINRRYAEGIAYYRKALELDPEHQGARAQLGVNLMRLGEEKEAREQLEKVYNEGYKNAMTANTLTLLDSYKNFSTFKTDNTILRLHKKEADLLHPYFESELKRAIATYDKKYKMKLARPVQVEVYPDHEDFAVRTLGMPGLGALGVSFGYVVAMDSPSGRKPGTFHWASTMWHELSHVYVLEATNFRVPRWFTEGLAVYEETAASPDWGDRLDPQTIMAIKQKKLLPIAELDRGFVHPSYPNQVIVSYFQAGRICNFIAAKWSYDKLLDMMHSFAKSTSTADVVRQQLGMEPAEFDKQFMAWLDDSTKTLVDGFDDWRKRFKQLTADWSAGKLDEVIKEGDAIRDMYPEYVETGSAYELLADAYEKRGDEVKARAELEAYSKIGGRDSGLLKKLSGMQQKAGQLPQAAATLERLNYIYPQDEELHRKLGDLYMTLNKPAGAVKEYQAVVAMKPIDQATARYNLARALRSANRIEEAKDQILQSLEAAPGYKPAQHLLLEMSHQ
jgi:cellulose synthase operon protein C